MHNQCLRTLTRLPQTTSGVALEWQMQTTPIKLRLKRQASLIVERGLRLPTDHILQKTLGVEHH
jgi:hypothetical protein